jgi:hypothetical protein
MKISEFENRLNNLLISADKLVNQELKAHRETFIRECRENILSGIVGPTPIDYLYTVEMALNHYLPEACASKGMTLAQTMLCIATYALAFNELKSENLI